MMQNDAVVFMRRLLAEHNIKTNNIMQCPHCPINQANVFIVPIFSTAQVQPQKPDDECVTHYYEEVIKF